MNNIINFVTRNALWLTIAAISLLIFRPGAAELKTLLLVAIIESAAIALSGVALFAYTKIDFTKDTASSNLGFIFLGVHISVGLIVLGVYLAQYGG
jgi:hypothetical protein